MSDVPTDSTASDITCWLNAWRRGDEAARSRLLERIYPDLRRLVGHHLKRRSDELTLQTTELIHELYLRLDDQRVVQWQDRRHFFAIAGRLLRRIMVDRERRSRRQKRGAGMSDAPLSEGLHIGSPPLDVDLLALDQALEELRALDEAAAVVIELRYFLGLSHDETAQALELGRATVGRRWRFARAWLRQRLSVGESTP